jgi:hypothetical protein
MIVELRVKAHILICLLPETGSYKFRDPVSVLCILNGSRVEWIIKVTD